MADLHALLQAAAIPGPYVLVGHSTGGLIVRLYASTYPNEVAGLALVDAIPEGVQTAMTPEHWKVYDRLLLVDPPKELATYKDLETIDFDESFDEMRRAAKCTPPVKALCCAGLLGLSHRRFGHVCRQGH